MAFEIVAPSPFLNLRNQSPRGLTTRTMVEEYYKPHREDGTKQTIKAAQTVRCVVRSFTYLRSHSLIQQIFTACLPCPKVLVLH